MESELGAATLRKVVRRLVPFAMLMMFLSYIDRGNISYAALQMNKDLGFNAQVYGNAASIFFIGHFFFEIPSNLILARTGARRWLARIMVTWGLVATAMTWVGGETSFYVMRFLLGLAESGLLPGLLFYFSLWIPAQDRGKTLSLLMSTSAISLIIAGPLSTSLMGLDGWFGLKGWQLMFLIEGIPSILVGFSVLWYLTDSPEKAGWLDERQKRWLVETLRAERAIKETTGPTTLFQGFFDPRVWLITLVCFFLICDNFGTVFWLPQIIKDLGGGLSNFQIGLLSAVPYALGATSMILWGRHSDRTGDRRWHLVCGALVGAFGFALAGLAPNKTISFIGLCFSTLGVWSMFGVFWAQASDLLSGAAAAGGLALINSFGTLGGTLGPWLVGFIRNHTATFTGSLLALAGFGLVTALLASLLKNELPTHAKTGATAPEAVG